MANTIKFRRGTKTNLPILNQGEPAYCTDTDEVFVGTGTENLQLYPQSFVILSDTPSTYTGYGGKFVQVKSTEDGLEFGDGLGVWDIDLDGNLMPKADVTGVSDAWWEIDAGGDLMPA